MNRKQRRSDRRVGAALAGGGHSGAPASATLANLFAAAVAQHQAGAFAEAERRYRSILSLFPDHADSLHNLGLLALHSGNPAAAADFIGQAVKLNDHVAEYHYNLALAWRALNRMDRVAAHLERAIELRPDNDLAHLNLGNVRREQGRMADAVACYQRAIALNPNSPATHFNLGNLLTEQRRFDEAIASYQRALALQPNFAEAHHRLGVGLAAQNRPADAIGHLEQAITLKPDLIRAHDDLGVVCLEAGRSDLAVRALGRSLEFGETPERKALFAQAAKTVTFTAANERLRGWVLRALAEGWARPRELAAVCISLVKLNPALEACIARAAAAWPALLDGPEPFGPAAFAALADDALLVCLLQCDPVTDIGVERVLTNIRHAMLVSASAADGGADGTADERHLRLFAAVARQCFINEYVYALAPEEADRARELQTRLAQALRDGAPVPPLWPITVAAYFPLHTTPHAQSLLGRAWPDFVGAVFVQQVEEPLRESEIAAAMPALTAIEDEVSRAVRRQYEENPYPRWIRSGPPVEPIILKNGPAAQSPDVLVAGCGTGLSAVEFARQLGNARILALDLSLASLSYAKRMAESFRLGNIEFAQADIMHLGSIGRTFDFIDSSGVLHHLADPWAGWRILLSLLRPGGIMQVGLYSDFARRSVVAARALIAERGFPATPEGIRSCREYILAAADPLLKSITQWADFFTVGECRDLLFHVQEHRVTLPQIKSFLADNAVDFAGFIPEPSLLQRFAARFPERSAVLDLDRWHTLETEQPDLFANMYQFWIRKPGGAGAI